MRVVPARRPAGPQRPVKKPRLRPKPAPKPYVAPELRERQRISVNELVQLANEYEVHIEEVSQQLKAQLADAKAVGEPIRLNCLLEKFFQVQNFRAVASRAMRRLEVSMTERDEDAVFRNFNAVATAHQAVLHFAEQASTCSSSPGFQMTSQSIETKMPAGDDKVEDGDFPSFPLPISPVPDRPAYASPYI